VKRISALGVPLFQQAKVGAYVAKQKMLGNKRFPLVLMLEPLFQCNLACAGCGKIDYPMPIMKQRLSVEECLGAAEECGAPIVAIPGGEPLIHNGIGEIVEGLVKKLAGVGKAVAAETFDISQRAFHADILLVLQILDQCKDTGTDYRGNTQPAAQELGQWFALYQ